jgi:hypothetical protein
MMLQKICNHPDLFTRKTKAGSIGVIKDWDKSGKMKVRVGLWVPGTHGPACVLSHTGAFTVSLGVLPPWGPFFCLKGRVWAFSPLSHPPPAPYLPRSPNQTRSWPLC